MLLLSLQLNYDNIFAQTTKGDTILFTNDFFNQSEPLDIVLKFDVKKYMNEKSDTNYLMAKMDYTIDSVEYTKDVRIRARGESRRRHCYLPPFWLNIRKGNFSADFIAGSNKIKVVTDCRGGGIYVNYLMNEYLIYNLYNLFTENSFRTRLVKIKYIDTGRKNRESDRWAFMIEPEELLGERIDALVIEFDNLNYRHTDSLSADIMCFFQYMIGNTDFTVNGRHNVKLFKYTDYTKPNLITVPYDFDFAGFVNADYANPAEILNIKDVTERYYLGMCRSDEQYQKVMDIFIQKKGEIYSYINSFEYLNKRSLRSAINYIDEFYEEMENPNFIRKKLKSTCRH